MDYATLKTIHVASAFLSISGFVVRGALMLGGSPLLKRRFVRVAPHVVDTVLLASAILLAWQTGQYPIEQSWLTAKVVALFVYIFLGSVALSRGRTRGIRAAAFVLALGTVFYIVSVAVTRTPAGAFGFPADMHAAGSVDPDVYRAIVAQSADAIILSDREGVILVWNHGAERMFGYGVEEALGRSLDLIIPERMRAAHWKGFRRAVEAGKTQYAGKVMTTRSMHKDGRTLYVDLSFGVVDDGAGGLAGVLATGRDVTERYLADKALRARVQELENKP